MKTTKFFSILFILSIVLSLIVGCAAPQQAAEQPAADPATEAAAADAPVEAATGKVTELTVWSFIDQHLTFFEKMAETWNAEHPDEQIVIVPTKIPWTEIHDQLYAGMMAGEGLPDIADIEISRWPQFMEGDVQLLDLNPYVEPYKADLVIPIMDVFSKDGHLYGAPSHLGATVMYYNTELLEQGGVDYTTIKTWADYEAALKTYKDNTGKYMNYCETYGAYQFTVLLGEQGKDLIDDQGMPQLTTPEAMKAVAEIKKWKDADICNLIPGGNADTDEGKAAVANGEVAALMYPLWYMSRFSDEMPQLSGKIVLQVHGSGRHRYHRLQKQPQC
jgi:arabinosaccharide transport system substrate-binding protein